MDAAAAVKHGGVRRFRYPRVGRVVDVLLASTLLIILSPLLGLVALAVLVDGGLPIIYWQTRAGRDQVPFRIAKFRAMVLGAERLRWEVLYLNEATPPLFKAGRDPPVTLVGKVLRGHGLDELPQLWNIVRGQMSFVGPRPLVPAEAEAFGPEAFARFAVLPGITGPWQVRAESALSLAEMATIDLEYLGRKTSRVDLGIILRTAWLGLSGGVLQ